MQTDLEDRLRAGLTELVKGPVPSTSSVMAQVLTRTRGARRRHRIRQGATWGIGVVAVGGVGAAVVTSGILPAPHPSAGGAVIPAANSAAPTGGWFSYAPATGATPTPASPSSASDIPQHPTPTAAESAAVTLAQQAQSEAATALLTVLARAVAAPAGGQLAILPRDNMLAAINSPEVDALVSHTSFGGSFSLSVSLDPPGTPKTVTAMTAAVANESNDGKPATLLLSNPTMVAFSSTYSAPEQAGREVLWFRATTSSGGSVSVMLDNDTNQGLASKSFGPTWKEVGITPSTIKDAVMASGILSR